MNRWRKQRNQRNCTAKMNHNWRHRQSRARKSKWKRARNYKWNEMSIGATAARRLRDACGFAVQYLIAFAWTQTKPEDGEKVYRFLHRCTMCCWTLAHTSMHRVHSFRKSLWLIAFAAFAFSPSFHRLLVFLPSELHTWEKSFLSNENAAHQ